MNTIKDFLAPDHRRCDDLFAAAEAAGSGRNWSSAESAFGQFRAAMERHFAMEEEVVFPAFETRTGMEGGPTSVMRVEHGQMREMFERMARMVEDRDLDGFLGDCDTLLILMQQHNIKEEQILYPMADRALAAESDELLRRMQAVA